jgi:hypothetical protein
MIIWIISVLKTAPQQIRFFLVLNNVQDWELKEKEKKLLDGNKKRLRG